MATSTKKVTSKGIGSGGGFPGPNGKKPGGNGWHGGDGSKRKFSPASYRITMWVVLAAVLMMFATGARAQHSFESVTTVGERGTSAHAASVVGDLARDRRHSKAAYAAQVTLIATYAALSYGLSIFGRRGFFIFPALYAALLVFYDVRPDIGQKIFPKLWHETQATESRKAVPSGQRAKRPNIR